MEKGKPMKRFDGPVRRRVVRRPQPRVAEPREQLVDKAVVQPEAVAEVVPLADGTAAISKPWWRWSRKRLIITFAIFLVLAAAAVGVRAYMASLQAMTENKGNGAPVLQGEVDPTKLKGEGDGRINILLLGTGGDGHDGGKLTDTIMVASIDPVNKNVAMLSIPRDLYVRIPGFGYSKINASGSYGGPELTKQVVADMLDLPIHYYVQADFAAFRQAVDAVGGVTVNNPERLYDNQYPCDNGRGYCVFNLPAGEHQMNGALALKYARCRHGSCGSDFGRAERQQQLLVALRAKAMEASTLTNPIKVNGLISSVGDHVRTDFNLKEMQKLAVVIKDIDVSSATTKVLSDAPDGLLVGGGNKYPGAGSILLPKAGDFDYRDIQELAHSIFVDRYLKQENAALQIQNGSTRSGLAAAVAKQLTAYNYNVVGVASAVENTHKANTIIDYSDGKKPYTIKYLEDRFNAKAVRKPKPPVVEGQPPQPDVVLTLGSNHGLTADSSRTTTKQ